MYRLGCQLIGRARYTLVFYRTRGGSEVVRDWLRDLPVEDRNVIGLDLMRIQYS